MSGNTISCSVTINAVSECDGADLKELLGFKPTVSNCLTISTDDLSDYNFARIEQVVGNKIDKQLDALQENYLNIEFGDPLLSYIEVKSMGHNKFKVFFEFIVYSIFNVLPSENETACEAKEFVEDLVSKLHGKEYQISI